MNVLVCVKRVPAPGTRINVTADGLAVDTSFLGFTTSPHEECAVEAAVQLVEQHGGRSTVLTVGPPEAEEQLRYAVSVGIDEAVLVPTDGSDWDPQRTATAIVEAIGDARGGCAVRPRPVRQRVGRLRRLPGRHPRRPGPRPARRQRRQGAVDGRRRRARRAGDRCWPGRVRAADAGGRRCQGGHQPAAVPDDEGPSGLEEGRRDDDRTDRTERRPAAGVAAVAAGAGQPHGRPRAGRRRRRRRSSTC